MRRPNFFPRAWLRRRWARGAAKPVSASISAPYLRVPSGRSSSNGGALWVELDGYEGFTRRSVGRSPVQSIWPSVEPHRAKPLPTHDAALMKRPEGGLDLSMRMDFLPSMFAAIWRLNSVYEGSGKPRHGLHRGGAVHT